MPELPLLIVQNREFVKSELVLGGQKSGKSRWAEERTRAWLDISPEHSAVLIATAHTGDDEMRQRIARHQADRAERVPSMLTVEEPVRIAQAISTHSRPHALVVVDCLTLWLTNLLMPASEQILEQPTMAGVSGFSDLNMPKTLLYSAQAATLFVAITQAAGPLVLVSNEIGLGVIPLGRDVRAFVDTLGKLNQDVAQVCERVTFMAAGLPLTLKGAL